MMSDKLSESSLELPDYLNKNLMFNRRVQINHNECLNIVLTRGPKIYVTQHKQVIAFYDLISTVMKDIECKQSDFALESSKLFNFDICFSYAGKEKHIFLLLKMRDKFIVMTIRNDHITIHKQYENVNLFKVEERCSVVHIRMEMMDGQSVCEDLYRLTTSNPMLDRDRFGGVGRTIADRIASVKAEISTTKLDVQKYFHTLAKELRFGAPTLHDSPQERVMLAKFGDTWIRRHNDMLVLGVPVYNCCYLSKRLVENIHLTLLSEQLNHFEYTYKLYKFEVDETTTPNYEEILNKEDNFLFPSFDQEWQPSEKNNLTPDTAAIVVITTSIPDFVDFGVLEFDCFVEYKIRDDGQINNLQNCIGKISVNSAIFYDPKFVVAFRKDNVYKDLLAVTSTSEFVFIKLVFIEMAMKESFYVFLLSHLEFSKTTAFPEESANNDDDDTMNFDFLSTSNVQHHSTGIYFLSKDSSYWKNTLIRTHSQGLVDELKIYNKCKDKISSLIQTFKSRFDKVAIEFVDARCDMIKLSVLRHALQKEVEYVKNNLNNTATNVETNFVINKFQMEFHTDSAYSCHR